VYQAIEKLIFHGKQRPPSNHSLKWDAPKAARSLAADPTETWWLSVVDIIQALIQQADYQTARKDQAEGTPGQGR